MEDLKYEEENVKAILLSDNAPSHLAAHTMVSKCGSIKVVFLPTNTTSLIQPMVQGIITKTKRLYRHHFLTDTVKVNNVMKPNRGMNRHAKKTLQNFHSYNIKPGITWTKSWKEIKPSSLEKCWKRLLHDTDLELKFESSESTDFHKMFWSKEDEGKPSCRTYDNK